MKKIILVICLISMILIAYLYYARDDENEKNTNIISVDENDISDSVSNWLTKSKELKGANIFIEEQDGNFKYFLYYEAIGNINYCKYTIEASYIKNKLMIEISKKPVYKDSDVKTNAFYCIEIPEKAKEINVMLDGTTIDWNEQNH